MYVHYTLYGVDWLYNQPIGSNLLIDNIKRMFLEIEFFRLLSQLKVFQVSIISLLSAGR
jgi:hypothetical protein